MTTAHDRFLHSPTRSGPMVRPLANAAGVGAVWTRSMTTPTAPILPSAYQ
jgi:hypothetical protein